MKTQTWRRLRYQVQTVCMLVLCITLGMHIIFMGRVIYYHEQFNGLYGFTVLTTGNSMIPTFYPGERANIRVIAPWEELEVGKIYSYRSLTADTNIGHRYLGPVVCDNDLWFVFKGDNNPSVDLSLVSYEQVIGEVLV